MAQVTQITAHTAMMRCQELVVRAMNAAFKEHGALTRDPVRACAILTEEIGEVAKEALAATRSLSPQSDTRTALARLRVEVEQVAATAIWMLNNLTTKGPGK